MLRHLVALSIQNETAQVPVAERPEIDRWVLSVLNTLVKGVQKEMESYDPTRAGRLIEDFVNNDLSNWYVRLNRKRFWGKEMSQDKLAAYQTLYTCLTTVAKLLAPFAPFFADQLFCDLGAAQLENTTSVHIQRRTSMYYIMCRRTCGEPRRHPSRRT